MICFCNDPSGRQFHTIYHNFFSVSESSVYTPGESEWKRLTKYIFRGLRHCVFYFILISLR